MCVHPPELLAENGSLMEQKMKLAFMPQVNKGDR